MSLTIVSMVTACLTSPRVTRAAAYAAVLAATVAAAGCTDDASDPTNPPPTTRASCAGDPPTLTTTFPGAGLQALGGGAIRCRYTGELTVHGTVAYTSTWGRRGTNVGNAIYIWDVSGDVPALEDSLTVAGAVTTGDIQVSDDGRLLVVATEFETGSIVIYDLQDPLKPQQVARFSSASTAPGVHTAEVARVNGTLYAFLSVDPADSFSARLVVVDLTDPAHPTEVLSQVMGNPFVHDVFVRDGILFTALWDDGLAIWDIGGAGRGSPAVPVLLGRVATVGGNVHNVWWVHDPVTGAKRYAVVGEEQAGTVGSVSAGDIHVVDVSDLTDPREVAYYHVTGAGTHNFSVDEERGILYAAYYNGGVRALDVRGDLAACTAEQRAGDGRCDLTLMGREIGVGLVGGLDVLVWGVVYSGGSVYASDMFNGLWKLTPAVQPVAP